MPATKTKSTRKSATVANQNGMPGADNVGDVLTLSEAALYLRVGEVDVIRMVQTQGLAARQIGKEWRFLKSALQGWLAGAPAKSSKQALLNLAGKFKDDPYHPRSVSKTQPGSECECTGVVAGRIH